MKYVLLWMVHVASGPRKSIRSFTVRRVSMADGNLQCCGAMRERENAMRMKCTQFAKLKSWSNQLHFFQHFPNDDCSLGWRVAPPTTSNDNATQSTKKKKKKTQEMKWKKRIAYRTSNNIVRDNKYHTINAKIKHRPVYRNRIDAIRNCT